MLHFIAPLENIDVQRTVFKITLKSLLLQECEQSLFQDMFEFCLHFSQYRTSFTLTIFLLI